MIDLGPVTKVSIALAFLSVLTASPGAARQLKAGAIDQKTVETASLAGSVPRASNAIRTVNANSTVWLAPIGHRQPRAIDVPASASKDSLYFAREDAAVDRAVNGICRGC